jgi:hypothetical protein
VVLVLYHIDGNDCGSPGSFTENQANPAYGVSRDSLPAKRRAIDYCMIATTLCRMP